MSKYLVLGISQKILNSIYDACQNMPRCVNTAIDAWLHARSDISDL